MEILEHVIINLTADDLRNRVVIDRTKMNAERSTGVHLSGVLQYLAYAPGGAVSSRNAQGGKQDFEENYPMVMAMGHAWEEFAVSLYPDLIWQPGEVERDEIYGTPDGITWGLRYKGEELDVNEEFKFTTKSMKLPTEDWYFCRQGMSYCAMKGLNHVRWHVCWVHGDYKKQRWPIYTRTLVRFEDAEIERWWSVVRRNKEKAKSE